MEWLTDKEKMEEIESERIEKQKAYAVREKRRKEIMESTDPSMDEVITIELVGHPNTAFGGVEHISMQVTKREKMFIDEGFIGRSRSEIEEERRRVEERKFAAEKEKKIQEELEKIDPEKAQRRKEIMESTDPSMDEMGTLSWKQMMPGGPVGPGAHEELHSIKITKRQKLLIDAGVLDKEEIYNQQESIREEKRLKQSQAEREQRIGKIMLSNNPELDEECEFMVFEFYDGNNRHYRTIHGTERQRRLWKEGALPESDVKKLVEESKKEAEKKTLTKKKSQISFGTIKSAMRKILGKEEK